MSLDILWYPSCCTATNPITIALWIFFGFFLEYFKASLIEAVYIMQCSNICQIIKKRSYLAGKEVPRYLDPHKWKGLPADQIFELHNERIVSMGQRYNPNDDERMAILSTIKELSVVNSPLEYVYGLDNFKERIMTDTPSKLRGLPKKLSNVFVKGKGETAFEKRRIENLVRVSAYEMPLLAKLRKPYSPSPNTKSPLRLEYFSNFSNKSDSAFNRKVVLTVALADLNLTPAQQHKYKVLLGNKMNLNTNVLRLTCLSHAEAPQNAREVVARFQRLLMEVKDPTKDDFSDIPLDRRFMRDAIRKPLPVFPASWARPQDAPMKPHNIVRQLVDKVKNQRDQEYITKMLP